MDPTMALNASIYLHYICLHFHQRKSSTSSEMANKLIESFGRAVTFLPFKVLKTKTEKPHVTQKLLKLVRSFLFPLSWVVANIPE